MPAPSRRCRFWHHSLQLLAALVLTAAGCFANPTPHPGGGDDPTFQLDASNSQDSAGNDSAGTPPPADAGVEASPVGDTSGDSATGGDSDPDKSDTSGDTASDAATPDTASDTSPDTVPGPINPDLNGDGTLNILVIGTSQALKNGAAAFSPTQVAAELQNILAGDAGISLGVNVVAEDVYATKTVTTGYGQGGELHEWTYRSHSLAQYYYWPEGRDARMANLAGTGDTDWDYVVIGGDPYIVSTMPGYYSLGVNKVAAKVAEGGAQPLLLMLWPKASDAETSVDHFAEFTYRTADGAKVDVDVVPAGRAWEALPAAKQDSAPAHPSPNGAYVAAASIYTHLYGQSAATSDYTFDDELADVASSTVVAEVGKVWYQGPRSFVSPFKGAEIPDRVLHYNHTGTSSENGILKGLKWVLGKAQVTLVKDGEPPINFNYGRANTEFEANKRYEIDPAKFDFSLGFPMQDHSNHGDTSMLYGLDGRRYDSENGTDLGAARKMVEDAELPHGRTIPIRTLHAQMKEAYPAQSAYSDGWHMNGDLDKASGAFMYTLLTGHCALDAEPTDTNSAQWRSWMAHKVGYETAWTLMHLSGKAPGFKVMPDAPGSTFVTPTASAGLSISFVNPPTGPVTVKLSTNNAAAVTIEPSELVFTPGDHSVPQVVTMTGLPGELSEELFIVTATTESSDSAFDAVVDRWEYTVIRE